MRGGIGKQKISNLRQTFKQFISLVHNIRSFRCILCPMTVRILDFEAFRQSGFSGQS